MEHSQPNLSDNSLEVPNTPITKSGKLKRTVSEMVIHDSEGEFQYYRLVDEELLISRLHSKATCTVCGKLFMDSKRKDLQCCLHPILRVLMCSECKDFYGDGNFSADEDEDDKYCRWCGQGGVLLLCSTCICSFCSKCIRLNLGRTGLNRMKKDDNWKCFICNPQPLFHMRHIAKLYLLHKSITEEAEESEEKIETIQVVNQLLDNVSAEELSKPSENKPDEDVSNATKPKKTKLSFESTMTSLKLGAVTSMLVSELTKKLLEKCEEVKKVDTNDYTKLIQYYELLNSVVDVLEFISHDLATGDMSDS